CPQFLSILNNAVLLAEYRSPPATLFRPFGAVIMNAICEKASSDPFPDFIKGNTKPNTPLRE
ncbi:MAG: hypothetical protein FWC43_14840, partial [Planctomycetaceae bacterium]|nr:hypothetical protein [Planctomycetaceae bacterium]